MLQTNRQTDKQTDRQTDIVLLCIIDSSKFEIRSLWIKTFFFQSFIAIIYQNVSLLCLYVDARGEAASFTKNVLSFNAELRSIFSGFVSQPCGKIMYSIVLQTIFHEFLNKNHKIKLLNSVQMHFVKLPLYIWSNLDDNIIIYFRKVFKESVEANWNWLDGQSLLQPKKWKQELFIHNQSSQLFWIFAFYWFYCCIAN